MMSRTVASLSMTVVLMSGCAGRVSPPGPVMADRPGFTDTPPAMPSGAIQLEAGFTDDRVQGAEYITPGELLVRVGVGGQTELRWFGNSYATRKISGGPTTSGLEDQKFGFKTNLRTKPDSVHSLAPNVSFLAATTLPTGADGFTATKAQPEAKLAMNWTTASPFSLYSNVGVGSIYNETGHASRAWLSTAGWWAVNPKISAFAEGMVLRGTLGGGGSGTKGNWVDGGLTYLVNDRFQLDARVGHGLGETKTERFFGVGLAKRW
jgi:hypothetical protein